jgi:hypothetical protein
VTKPRLTYANVAGTLALVVCMSGTAVAAATINGSEINNRSISHTKLIRNTLTGAEVRESKLGTVPNAHRIDGRRVYRIARNIPSVNNGTAPLVLVQGLGTFEVECSSGGNAFTLHYTNTSANPTHYSYTKTGDGAGTDVTAGSRVAAGAPIEIPVDNTGAGGDAGFRIAATFLGSGLKKSLELTIGGVTRIDSHARCAYAFTGVG